MRSLSAMECLLVNPEDVRQARNHLLFTTIAASLLPHLLKVVFDQPRPDRLTVVGHLHGVPLSGNAEDAFPSGHAIHIGALLGAASRLPTRWRAVAWVSGLTLVSTRVLLLAHWTSDVLVGLAIGMSLERILRRVTRHGNSETRT